MADEQIEGQMEIYDCIEDAQKAAECPCPPFMKEIAFCDDCPYREVTE